MTQLWSVDPLQIQAVHRGAALLDRLRPGWEREVFPDSLRMDEVGECVLAQLFGGFQAGLDALQPEERRRPFGMARLMFVGYYGLYQGASAWQEEIRARRLSAESA